MKLRYRQVQLNCTKFYFTNDVVREWNKLPPFMMQYTTIKAFKSDLTTTSNIVSISPADFSYYGFLPVSSGEES